MHGDALTLFALLVFSGLLWPFARGVLARCDDAGERAAGEPLPRAAPDVAADPGLTLTPVELALIAELSLEQARAHDEVAEDTTQRPDTRRAAAASAAAWRERALMLQSEVRRRSAHPMLAAGIVGASYTGPERRRGARRTATRRARLVSLVGGVVGRDRRARRDRRDRREQDRRRPAPASR